MKNGDSLEILCIKKIQTQPIFVEVIWRRNRVWFLRQCTIFITRMWANAQHDGRPAKYRWRTLFNATKFGWRPLIECRAVMLPRRETRWNLLGCPKLPNGSQPLVGWSSPHCEDMWGRYRCLTSFFPIVNTCFSCEDIAQKKLCDGAQMANFYEFLGPAFPASRVRHISDLHSKFALGPHHV